MAGLTLDSGALIGLERRHHRIRRVFATAVRDNVRVTAAPRDQCFDIGSNFATSHDCCSQLCQNGDCQEQSGGM